MMSPMMPTAATAKTFFTMSANAFQADVQNDVPSMDVMMYARRLIHSMIFCKYHKQYST